MTYNIPHARDVEVVREGRFTYRVLVRMSNGLDMTLEPTCLFAWSARRVARRTWERERRSMSEPDVLMPLAVDVEEAS